MKFRSQSYRIKTFFGLDIERTNTAELQQKHKTKISGGVNAYGFAAT